MSDLDFPSLASRLLTSAESLLNEWFPAGVRRGHEFEVGSLQGESGQSLKINLNTGMWKDFSDDGRGGGDLTSLYAAKLGITQAQAYRVLVDYFPASGNGAHSGNGTHPPKPRKPRTSRQLVVPVPADAEACPCVDPKLGPPVRIFTYRTANGGISGLMARYEPTPATLQHFNGRSKEYKPWTYGSAPGKPARWSQGGHPAPRPLYGLDDLAARPQSPVLLVEGEPCVEAARTFAASYVVMTWQHGAPSVDMADLTPLHGRSILLWPDADEPGIAAAWKIARRLLPLCPQVKLIDPAGQPDGWDAADFVTEVPGLTWVQFAEWAKPRVRTITQQDVDEYHAPAPKTPILEPAVTVSVVESIPEPVSTAAPQIPPAAPVGDGGRKVNWYVWKLDCNGAGEPLANLNNAVTVLERDAAMQGLVWYDEFLNRILTPVAGSPRPREWTDRDDINLALDLQRRIGVSKISIDIVSKSVQAIAMRHLKNCVRDWIDSLAWDGTPRIDHFFEDHFGAERSAYTTAASKNFWLSMLARVYRPGCKVDNVIVLEGAEGLGKSTVLQIVAGEWFTEQHESLMNPKAFFEVIQGALITEIGEMDAFSRAELTKVMAVVTCRSDKYRDPYGRYATHHPRQGIFVCTTNERASNRSPDGGRRWWYIACTEVDTASIAANREQYFAEARVRLAPESGWNEAMWRFNRGEPWWIMPGDETRAEQAARYEADTWAPAVEEFLRGRVFTTTGEVLTVGLGFKTTETKRAHEMRVGACLRYLGWVQKVERDGARIKRVWRLP